MNRTEKFDVWWEEYKSARQEVFFGLSKHETELRRQYALDGFLAGGTQLDEANDVITDFLRTHDHADFCPAKISGKTVYCNCMNIGHYNDKKNIERAKAYTEKWSVE